MQASFLKILLFLFLGCSFYTPILTFLSLFLGAVLLSSVTFFIYVSLKTSHEVLYSLSVPLIAFIAFYLVSIPSATFHFLLLSFRAKWILLGIIALFLLSDLVMKA